MMAISYIVTTLRDLTWPNHSGPGSARSRRSSQPDPARGPHVADVDLLEKPAMPVVLEVERAQRHAIGTQRGGLVAQRVIGPGQGERGEPEARVGAQRPAQRGGGPGGP